MQVPDGLTAEKLNTIANWFDLFDGMAQLWLEGIPPTKSSKQTEEDFKQMIKDALVEVKGDDIQQDLRRWAMELLAQEITQ